MCATTEEMLTTLPYPCCFMKGETALVHCQMPRTFTAITFSHSSSEISSKGFLTPRSKYIAALLTRTSIPPNSLAACWAIRDTLLSSVTSVCTNSAFEPFWPLISSASASPSRSRMSAMATLAPSAANALAYTAPIPLAPPVMITSFPMSLTLLFSSPNTGVHLLPRELPFCFGVEQGPNQVEQDSATHKDHHPRRYVCRGGACEANEGRHDTTNRETHVPAQARS